MTNQSEDSPFHADLRRSTATEVFIPALKSIGITDSMISQAIEVTEATIRNWASGRTQPRSDEVRDRLDDLRTVLQVLIEGGESIEDAVEWLKSRENASPYDRPIEVISRLPEKVIKQAGQVVGRELLGERPNLTQMRLDGLRK
jgi:hypothetical protein